MQLYVGFPVEAGEPPRQLKGFQKVTLEPGKSATVTFDLDSRALSYWDETTAGWKTVKGTYSILVGASSRDIKLTGEYTVE